MRKLKAVGYLFLLVMICLHVFGFRNLETLGDLKGVFLISLLIAGIGCGITLVYGVPVSILSDKITQSLKGWVRLLAAFILHAAVGMIALWVQEINVINIGLLFAIMYWVIDEILRKLEGTPNNKIP